MKEKSIIFRGDGVNTILEDRKTKTRRVIKLPGWSTGDWKDFELDDDGIPMIISRNTGCLAEIRCPYGEIGDRLWVRETWRLVNDYGRNEWSDFMYPEYRADPIFAPRYPICSIDQSLFRSGWQPSIFMPRWASRITLEIVSVRVERLQEITPADCKAEGIFIPSPEKVNIDEALHHLAEYKNAYENLWNQINLKRGYGWETNCWVWCITFRRIVEE